MYLEHYLKTLDYDNIPNFLIKYLDCPSLIRLKKVGYFCGMDYASPNIYNFEEYISRFDHSLTTALLTYKLTKDKKTTLAALFHDVSTPCFSHVIDYMNQDYEIQESTEEYTELILKQDKCFLECIKKDNIDIEEVINFKNYSVVDNERPKLCADRLDGIILTGAIWTKNITINDITNIINDILLFKNEFNELKICFKNVDIAKKVIKVNNVINQYCHSKEDNYMMLLLSEITRLLINKKYLTYDDLYIYNEQKLFNIIDNIEDSQIKELRHIFKTIKKENIINNEIPNLKNRSINPLVNSKRIDGEIITSNHKYLNKVLK